MGRLAQVVVVMAFMVPIPVFGQAQTGPLTVRFTQLLRSLDNGHSPSQEEVAAAAGLPQPEKDDLDSALPLILKALDSPDRDVRTYTLFTLSGLEVVPEKPADAKSTAAPSVGIYKGYVATMLATAIPKIGAHLTDEDEANRQTTVTVLQGFAPNPPATVYPPLLDFLKRDDSISLTGEAVVGALMSFGVPRPDVAEAIAHYLGRSDQTARSRADLIDTITLAPFQSQAVNAALLGYLDTDDASVRARLVLSLPQLDLSPEVFADTRAKVSILAANQGESLPVINAAKAVSGCWTGPKMTVLCPIY